MFRIGFVLCLVLLGCKGKKSAEQEGKGFSYEKFSQLFHPLSLPYQLSEADLINNKDTTTIRSAEFGKFISDSMKTKFFGKGSKPRYIALGYMKVSNETALYLVKAVSGKKPVAFLYAFNQDQFASVLPFLVPDADPSTSQWSTIDKAFSITKNITQKKPDVTLEGKDVYAYDVPSGQFSMILTNPIDAGNSELINPIDTFSRKHKLAGDYIKDKRNFVTVRDGRNPNQLLVYIHLEKNEGACIGDLKGDLLITSSSTAIYRQGGDPCVLSFRFSGSSVTVKEDEGCGSHRGIDCSFDGTFTRKKQQKPKATTKKTLGK